MKFVDKKNRPTSKLSNKDRLARYRNRVEAAKGFRESQQLDALWRRLNDLYRGKQLPAGMDSDDAFVVNVAFSTINVIGPSVAINYPKTVVTPIHPEQEDNAVIAEAVIDYWWRHYKVLTPFQAAVKDFLIYGFGWIKLGWLFAEEENPDVDAAKRQYEALRFEADRFAAENPELAVDLPSDDEIRAQVEVETKWNIVEDRPFVDRISPHDVFVDPEGTGPHDIRWIAHRTVKTIDEVESTYGYKKSVLNKIEPDSFMPEDWFRPSIMSDEHVPEDDVARYTCWEFYDIVLGEMCVFPEQGDQFLVDPVQMPYGFGHPFVMLRNYDVPEQFYPMGELEALEPLQNELNLTRTAMFNDRKAYRRRHLYDPNAFDRVGRAALESDEDNILIPVKSGVPLGEAVIPMPGAQPNPQLYQDSQVIEDDITLVTGINEYMRGSMPEIRRTATEAAIIQDVANARATDKLARVEWAVGEISRRMLILAQQFMHEGQVARITSRKNRVVHFEFEPEDIQGEFDFEVQGGSTRPKNEQQRRQTALDMLQALAPYGDPTLGLVNMQEVIAHALRYGFDVDDPERFMGGGPQMMPQPGMEGMPPGEGGVPPELEAMMGGGAPPPVPLDPAAMAMVEAGLPPMGELAGGMANQLAGQVGLSL